MHSKWCHSCERNVIFKQASSSERLLKTWHQYNNFYRKNYQNSIQLCTLIYWLNANWSTSSEKFRGPFCLPPQPNGAMQNHSMLRPGYRSVQCLDTTCTVGILRTYCHSICGEKKISRQWILCFKWTHHHGNLQNGWINVRMLVLNTWPSRPQFIEYNFWYLLLYFDTFAWSNANDTQTSYSMFETVNDPSFLPYIICIICVTTSSSFCVLVLRLY